MGEVGWPESLSGLKSSKTSSSPSSGRCSSPGETWRGGSGRGRRVRCFLRGWSGGGVGGGFRPPDDGGREEARRGARRGAGWARGVTGADVGRGPGSLRLMVRRSWRKMPVGKRGWERIVRILGMNSSGTVRSPTALSMARCREGDGESWRQCWSRSVPRPRRAAEPVPGRGPASRGAGVREGSGCGEISMSLAQVAGGDMGSGW